MSGNNLYGLITKTIEAHSSWQLETYQLYWDYLEHNQLDSIVDIIKFSEANSTKDFLYPIEIGAVQFLAAFYPSKKLVKLASKQLSRELTLIHCGEHFSASDHQLMKKFADSIAEIPSQSTPTQIEVLSYQHHLPLFNEKEYVEINEGVNQLAEELAAKISEYRSSFFEKISDFSLDLIANFMLIRIHVLKFLAILPCLDHDRTGHEVKRIFIETLRRLKEDSKKARTKKLKGQKRPLPGSYIWLTSFTLSVSEMLPASFLSWMIRMSTQMMAKRFIAGVDIKDAYRSLQGLMASSREATIDQLGELVVSKKEADEYTDKVLEIIYGLEQSISKGELNKAGINKAHVSIKVTALSHNFKPQAFDYCYEHVAPRLIRILKAAKEKDVFVNIDAEHYHYRDCVFEIYKKVLLETPELKDFKSTGIVVQCYLKDAFIHLEQVKELAKLRGIVMPIRLVKGAYWDAETIEASAHNFEAPQFVNKEETDIHFRQMIFKTLESHEHLQLAVASHNIKDHCFAEVLRKKLFASAPQVEHQCLHMTYEGLSVAMAKMQWTTRNYIPVGNLLVGMAYLVRRIMENSSQVGVLTAMRSHKKSLDPKSPTTILFQKKDSMRLEQEDSVNFLTREFKNIYPLRSYLKKHFSRIDKPLKEQIHKLESGQFISSHDSGDKLIFSSSRPNLLLGKLDYGDAKSVSSKVHLLFDGFKKTNWKDNLYMRSEKLLAMAEIMLFKREELVTTIMLEAGKTIDEAIADVDEAIDFIQFYVREQIELALSGNIAPKGVVGVIAPWNFPLAIPCGMSVAALAAGNTVILKPAEQTNLVADALINLARKAGIGADIFSIEHGEGDVGAAIVDHELIAGVVFTGSKFVGEQIYKKLSTQLLSKEYSHHVYPKFAITEMGGKNAIIVTNNCELDETISGIIYAAFAHAGQKCSAASRVIIDNKIKETFIQRFRAAVADLKVGPATDYATLINPLITLEDKKRVIEMASRALEEVKKFKGEVIIDRSAESYDHYCVGPSVFELPAKAVLKEKTIAKEEVFGPIIHIIGYRDLDHAIEIFNSTDYALTGGVFCQSQDDLDYLLPKLEAGNIYINRPNTGARVAIEPFGGFKLSGTGPKAGGVDYLHSFNIIKHDNTKSLKQIFDVKVSEIGHTAQFSKLSWPRRKENTLKLASAVAKQFEVLLGEITESSKNKIIEFKNLLESNQIDLETMVFPNREIQGQLSFSMRDQSLGNGVIVDSANTMDIDLIQDVLVNLLVGNGVTLIATNEKIYRKWKLFVDWAYINGFSHFNLSLSKMTQEDLETFLAQMNLEFCQFVSADIPKKLKEALINKNYTNHLVRIFFNESFETLIERIKKYTQVRSFAINTMRHGAALDLII